jgi:hypothetical protein
VSILNVHGVRIEDISDLMGHSGLSLAPYGSPVAPRAERFLMPVRIGDGFMRLEVDGQVVATAAERPAAGGKSPICRSPSTATRRSPR